MSADGSGARRAAPSIPSKILSGYGRLFAAVALWALAALGAVAAAAAIVWPLWALAMRDRALFNAIFIALASIAALVLAALGLRRRIASGVPLSAILAKAGKSVLAVLALAGVLVSVYLCVAFAFRGLVLAALPAGIAALALSGWLFFGRKRA